MGCKNETKAIKRILGENALVPVMGGKDHKLPVEGDGTCSLEGGKGFARGVVSGGAFHGVGDPIVVACS